MPAAVGFYDLRVRYALGFANLTAIFADQRASLGVLKPEIVSHVRTKLGDEVVVRALSDGSGVGTQSFLLHRGAEGWRVRYDTLVGDTLSSYVEQKIENRAPGSSTPSLKAQRAARRYITMYRTLFAKVLAPRPQTDGRPPDGHE